MSRYSIVIFILLFSLTSCAQKSRPLKVSEYKIINNQISNDKQKMDAYALIAMDAYNRGDFETAGRFFEKLYDIDPQIDYLVDAIKAASFKKDYERIKYLIDKGNGKFGDNRFINRYLVAYYLDKKDIKNAQKTVDNLLKKDPSLEDFELAAIVARVKGNLKSAQNYYQKAYSLDHDPKALIDLAELLLSQNKEDEAISLLETHTRIYGCQKHICNMLIQIYTKKQNLDALEDIYIKLYEKTKEAFYANALLELYAYRKKYDDAISFLKKYKFNDEILLDVYTSKKEFKTAYELANRLYKETNNLKYLARAAILEYESSKTKDKKLLKDVSEKFEKSVYHLDDPLFYNYYAYLLIDHDIDVKKGIELVKKALKEEPDSLFYIDTLAWGYYKDGKCKEAYKLLKPYENKKNEQEIIEHIEKIKQCLKEKTK